MSGPPHLFLHSLRLGFATNSSSAHSVIFLPGRKDENLVEGHEYHDEHFLLASPEAKRPYLRLQLDGAGLAGELTGLLGGPVGEGRVNHQTQWSGPPELLAEIARWAMKEGVVILGGGDGFPHPESDFDQGLDPADFGDARVRRDPLGFWTVMESYRGTKARFSFARAADPHVLPFRSTWPELVDLKITERCEAGCAYCYQDSRPDGRHAPLSAILPIVERLKEAQVFEVVLGGGEPTEHPDFHAILAAIQKAGMRAAFTTRRLEWMDEQHRAKDVEWSRVAWAYSVQASDEVKLVSDRVRNHPRASQSVWLPAIHVVLGTPVANPEDLEQIAQDCRDRSLRLVLLGYKRTGRGAQVEPRDDSHWMATCTAAGVTSLSIDTALAEQFELQLRQAGVPPWSYDVEDGRFSMSIDAVTGLCGPSSWCEPDALFPLPGSERSVERAFEEINRRLGPSRRQRQLELEQLEGQATGDAKRLVLIDAALEGRCEPCGAPGATLDGGGLERPRSLCERCVKKGT
ncbi:MAG: radical SAM protein [Myxococcales bacterium]